MVHPEDICPEDLGHLSLRSKRFGKAFRTFDALCAFLAVGKLGLTTGIASLIGMLVNSADTS